VTMARTPPSLKALRAKRATAAAAIAKPPVAPKRATAPSFWTTELDGRLRALAPNLTASQIGQIIGATRDAVIGRCYRKGISLIGASKQLEARREAAGRAQPKPQPPRPRAKVKREKDLIAPNGSAESVYVNLAERREAAMVAPTADWQPKRLSIMDLRAKSCRWPLWTGTVPFTEKFYCGNEALPGLSYCPRCNARSVSAAYVAAAVDRRHTEAARAAA
jgi:hypothetical protein